MQTKVIVSDFDGLNRQTFPDLNRAMRHILGDYFTEDLLSVVAESLKSHGEEVVGGYLLMTPAKAWER